MEWFIKSML